MPLRRTGFSHSRRPRDRATGPEWVGGRLRFPASVGEGPAAYSPDLVLWVERPDDIVVGVALPGPDDPPFPVARVLSEAMERPLVGRPRRPSRVRIADPDDAADVRAFFGDTLDVVVAPTPELDTVVAAMAEDLSREAERSYFDEGVAPDDVARLFASAIELYQTAPWELLGERWEEEAASLVERMSRPPELRNTDGDELLLTTDHFAFDPERQTEVEALRVSDETRVRHPSVPWRQVIGMRHRVVHDYLAVDLEIVWAVVSEDLGPLIAALERIVPPQAGEPLDHAFSPSA